MKNDPIAANAKFDRKVDARVAAGTLDAATGEVMKQRYAISRNQTQTVTNGIQQQTNAAVVPVTAQFRSSYIAQGLKLMRLLDATAGTLRINIAANWIADNVAGGLDVDVLTAIATNVFAAV